MIPKKRYSQFTVRIEEDWYFKLVKEADAHGWSLNHYVVKILKTYKV